MKRTITIFAALFFGGALAVAYATTGVKDFSQRWTAAQNALTVAHHGIPEEKLHARALEILRTRVVAADEVNVDACVTLTKTTMDRTICE